MEAAEGGSGSSVDVLDDPIMCGSDFPLLPVQAYGRNSTKAEIRIYSSGGGINPSAGGRNPPPTNSQNCRLRHLGI